MQPTLKKFLALLLRWHPPLSGPSEDPFAGVREPRPRGPGGRGTSVAVQEPRSDEAVHAVAGPQRPYERVM